MATTVSIEGQSYVRRNPLGVIGLTLITLGIYWFYWHYVVNDEARRYLRDESIRPGVALLAVTLGALAIVPPFISIYHTGERVLRMERRAEVTNQISSALYLLLHFVVGMFGAAYAQEHLNRVWDRGDSAAFAAGMPPPPPPMS
jgi:hypothetical protein